MRNRKVLIVEDDLMSQDYLSILLKKNGIKKKDILIAGNSQQAISTFDEYINDISLIFIDVFLPPKSSPEPKNGYELTKIFKNKNPNIPIVIESAQCMNESIENGYKAGCDYYLTKPFSGKDITEIVNKYYYIGIFEDLVKSFPEYKKEDLHKIFTWLKENKE